MKSLIAGILAVAAGLLVANMLGVAAAEAPTTTTTTTTPPPATTNPLLRSVTVQGVANVPLAQGASAATATGVYRQAMAAAIADGQSKAEYLAQKAGATLGSVQSIVEGGGSISCSGEESRYSEYTGEQPDFGSGSSLTPLHVSQGAAVTPGAPAVRKSSKKKKKTKHFTPTAKKAAAEGCTLSAQVSLLYAIA